MHKSIVAARAAVDKAEAAMKRTLDNVQKKCPHEHVVQADSVSGEQMRLCIDCGFEEHSWWWGKGATNVDGKKITLTTGFVKQVGRDEFFSHRP
jgi:hypothetical protein